MRAIKAALLYEDNHLIALNKRAGELVQGDKTGDAPLNERVKAYLKEVYHKPGKVYLGTVHRLDRPTSGVVLFAKTGKALSRLNAMFKDRTIDKTYWALVENRVPKAADKLTHYLRKNSANNKASVFEQEKPDTKKAVLHYRLMSRLKHYTLLEIKLETGRHHQIRAQLSRIGLPIKGDLKYGAKRSNPDGSIALHARHMGFTHPVSKEAISITAPLPDDSLWRAAEAGARQERAARTKA